VLLFINAPNISVCDDVICDFADDVSGLLFSSRYISTRFCLNFLFCVLTGAAYRHDISWAGTDRADTTCCPRCVILECRESDVCLRFCNWRRQCNGISVSCRVHFERERVGTPFPLLKCPRTHYGRHCEPFSGPKKCTRLQDDCSYTISTFFGGLYPSTPAASGRGRPRCLELDPDTNSACLASFPTVPVLRCDRWCLLCVMGQLDHLIWSVRNFSYMGELYDKRNILQSLRPCVYIWLNNWTTTLLHKN